MNQEEILKEISKPEFLYLALGVLVVRTIVWLFFANTIRKTLLLIRPENRCILPNQVWGVAIILFNIYWNFEVAKRLRDSLINEFYDRKIAADDQPTYKKGLLYSWIYLASNIPLPLFFGPFLAILHIVTLINYWTNINSCARILREHDNFKHNEEVKSDEN